MQQQWADAPSTTATQRPTTAGPSSQLDEEKIVIPPWIADHLILMDVFNEDSTKQTPRDMLESAVRDCPELSEFKIEKRWDNIQNKEIIGEAVIDRHVVGRGRSENQIHMKRLAAYNALENLKKHCFYIEAKPSYFGINGSCPAFLCSKDNRHKFSNKCRIVTPEEVKSQLALSNVLNEFKKSEAEDLFFVDNFTQGDIDQINLMAKQMCFLVRMFGKNCICVYKKKFAKDLFNELMSRIEKENEKYRLILPPAKLNKILNASSQQINENEGKTTQSSFDHPKINITAEQRTEKIQHYDHASDVWLEEPESAFPLDSNHSAESTIKKEYDQEMELTLDKDVPSFNDGSSNNDKPSAVNMQSVNNQGPNNNTDQSGFNCNSQNTQIPGSCGQDGPKLSKRQMRKLRRGKGKYLIGNINSNNAGGNSNGSNAGGNSNGSNAGGNSNGNNAGGNSNGNNAGGNSNGNNAGGNSNGNNAGGNSKGNNVGPNRPKHWRFSQPKAKYRILNENHRAFCMLLDNMDSQDAAKMLVQITRKPGKNIRAFKEKKRELINWLATQGISWDPKMYKMESKRRPVMPNGGISYWAGL